jgi:RNA polymerase sigma-70 factor (ECF subfamily)
VTEEGAIRAAERTARENYGKLVAILAARDRDIAAAEDALSDALVAALRVWPVQGVPANPEDWLVTAARNQRRNAAGATAVRRRAEPEILRRIEEQVNSSDTSGRQPDNRLGLLFVCAHPAIDPVARAPLILQTVLGIDAARIARAYLVPPATMSQHLVRAKASVIQSG